MNLKRKKRKHVVVMKTIMKTKGSVMKTMNSNVAPSSPYVSKLLMVLFLVDQIFIAQYLTGLECFMWQGLQLNDPVQKFMDDNMFSATTSGPSSGNQTSLGEKFTKSNPDLFQVSFLSHASFQIFHVLFSQFYLFLCCILTIWISVCNLMVQRHILWQKVSY